MVRFGPSGNSQSFYDKGNKHSYQMPEWLKNIGLSAYEYQCNKGVRIKKETAEKIGDECKKNDIFLSIHGPYYINYSSLEEHKRLNSIDYVIKTLQVAKWMEAKRIIIHLGSCSKMTREKALNLTIDGISKTLEVIDPSLQGIAICPEVLGKKNQFGDLDEIIQICNIYESLLPCIDFGHIHARRLGGLNSVDDFLEVIEKIENKLGSDRMKNMHIHFSRVEYTNSGEKRHWTLADTQFGPEFKYLAEVIYKKNMNPVIICESRDKMAEDALEMKNIYESIKK